MTTKKIIIISSISAFCLSAVSFIIYKKVSDWGKEIYKEGTFTVKIQKEEPKEPVEIIDEKQFEMESELTQLGGYSSQ